MSRFYRRGEGYFEVFIDVPYPYVHKPKAPKDAAELNRNEVFLLGL